MAPDRFALDDEGAKALRRCVDGGRESRRAGSDDDGVEFAIIVQLGVDAEGSGELGPRRIYEDTVPTRDRIANDRDRRTSAVRRMFSDKLLACRGCSVVKDVGNAVSRQQIAEIVAALRPVLGYDRDLASGGGMGARPFMQELGECAVKLLVRLGDRLHDVVVEVVPGHAHVDGGGGVRISPVAPADQQSTLGEGLDFADFVEQRAAVHVRQGLIGEHQRHLNSLLGKPSHRLQRLLRRVDGGDRIVAAVAVGQRRRESLERLRVIVDNHEDRWLTWRRLVLFLGTAAHAVNASASSRIAAG